MGSVIENDSNGFVTESIVSIRASAEHVFDTLGKISKWWDSNHTYTLDATNLSLDLRVGGRFLEEMENGQGVVHSTVIFSKRGELLRLSGALGPLQMLGAHGTLTFQFEPSELGVDLHAKYVVMARNLQEWAAAVERVLQEQLIRLKHFIETGDPESTSD